MHRDDTAHLVLLWQCHVKARGKRTKKGGQWLAQILHVHTAHFYLAKHTCFPPWVKFQMHFFQVLRWCRWYCRWFAEKTGRVARTHWNMQIWLIFFNGGLCTNQLLLVDERLFYVWWAKKPRNTIWIWCILGGLDILGGGRWFQIGGQWLQILLVPTTDFFPPTTTI